MHRVTKTPPPSVMKIHQKQTRIMKDLDDEDVPKSNKDLDGNKKVKKSLPLVAGVGIGVAALAALAAGIVIVRKRVHR
mgnify:CR=1 FL=1